MHHLMLWRTPTCLPASTVVERAGQIVGTYGPLHHEGAGGRTHTAMKIHVIITRRAYTYEVGGRMRY